MIDLHIHTIYSDGEHTPLEVLNICKEHGVDVMSIADHNTMEGVKRAIEENPYSDLTIIPGIELGATWHIKGGTLHVLGYNIDMKNKNLNDVTQAIMSDNVMRLESCVSLLKKYYGFTFKDEDLEKIFKSIGNIGRPDIAKLCVEYGYCNDVQHAFKKYLNPIKDEIAKRRTTLTDKDCIDYIKGAGGIACLAHPIELKCDNIYLKEYIKKLMSYGLEAVEVYQSKHTTEYSRKLKSIVDEFGLLYSVGSDYHGELVTPDMQIGYGKDYNLCKNDATILSKILE